ncbi:MAG: hypothetical protein A2X86_00460 [Bdellovibrionales bacterium GWA2_49_15]|nr:MAG: hypothetical protein A2X86_00460 [Bdellovibrionales bacterium GWA2_49_15]HAZ13262.1 hypothetical protein [Bdellovibrionales bacterium]
MARSIFLDSTWNRKHLNIIKNRAGGRYTPKLNIELPISECFDGLSRTKEFIRKFRKNKGELKKSFLRVSSFFSQEDINSEYLKLKKEIEKLLTVLDAVNDYDNKIIDYKKIKKCTTDSQKLIWNLVSVLQSEKEKAKEKPVASTTIRNGFSERERFDHDIHFLYETQSKIRDFESFSESTISQLSNTPYCLLTGLAGNGKTHLLCDLIEKRHQNQLPGVLVFGELFEANDEPLIQINRQLKTFLTPKQFLKKLDESGKKTKCRAILAIDAVNETRNDNYWRRHLIKLIEEIKDYQNIALVVSVRTGFEKSTVSKAAQKLLIEEEHQGFKFKEWEAVNKFFTEFNLPIPEIPILTPEFQNPLFLLLFCKAFEKRSKYKDKRQIFKGHEGATYIFESFVDNVSKKIAKVFSISEAPGKNIWDTVIEKIAEAMVSLNSDRLSEEAVKKIIRNNQPSVNYKKFLNELERNLILVKSPTFSLGKKEYDGFEYRFPFQKFSDHLIGRYIFKKYELEFGKTNKNMETAKKFFSRRRKLGRYLDKGYNQGIAEALCIQCPEHLKGIEFFEVAPYLTQKHFFRGAFIESLVWRKTNAFTIDRKNTLKFINQVIVRSTDGYDQLVNAFISVAPIPDHPFNADFLHRHLSRFSMAKRDSGWTVFLHNHYGARNSTDRLIAWGWSNSDKSKISDDSRRLTSVCLTWFLTSSNRFVRDMATKSLVTILSGNLHVVQSLLEKFKNVNDPYVEERLYAVAYGCSIRSTTKINELKNLASWVYQNKFKKRRPPINILTRCYAKGVIDTALSNGIKLKLNSEVFNPPYKSKWPKKIPSLKNLRKKYGIDAFYSDKGKSRGFIDIWSSLMYQDGGIADFGNYVLNCEVRQWTSRSLSNSPKDRNKIYKDFKDTLKVKQIELLGQATEKFYGFDFSEFTKLMQNKTDDELEEMRTKYDVSDEALDRRDKDLKKEMIAAMKKFKKTLTEYQLIDFTDNIEPFLDDNGRIQDPTIDFDANLAQRWVFEKVVKLGWKEHLHGKFDSMLRHRSDRTENKPERIGKKYQWIALYELLARLADNFQFKEDGVSDEITNYEGTWQIGVRNIDPTCILKNDNFEIIEHLPTFNTHQKINKYNAWANNLTNQDWLKKRNDLPDPKKFIELVDDKDETWLVLESFIEWQDEIPPEQEKYDSPTRSLWYMFKSYFVEGNSKERFFRWAKKQNYMGRWMPESSSFYDVFLGEYPWAKAFSFKNVPFYSRDGWTDGRGSTRGIPAKILVTNDQYQSSGSSLDCSTEGTVTIKLPGKYLVDSMNIHQKKFDGVFYDSNNEIIVFDPHVFDKQTPSCVLIKKKALLDFLKKEDLSIAWTFLAEKRMIGGDHNKYEGRLDSSGAFSFDESGHLVGRKKNIFTAPN